MSIAPRLVVTAVGEGPLSGSDPHGELLDDVPEAIRVRVLRPVD